MLYISAVCGLSCSRTENLHDYNKVVVGYNNYKNLCTKKTYLVLVTDTFGDLKIWLKRTEEE